MTITLTTPDTDKAKEEKDFEVVDYAGWLNLCSPQPKISYNFEQIRGGGPSRFLVTQAAGGSH